MEEIQQRTLFANSKQSTKVASSSDLRTTVLECHTKISKELVWGKKQSSDSIKYLDVSDAEAFALDSAIRAYWELKKSQNPLHNSFIDVGLTRKLREVSLSILASYSDQFTREYSFVVPDPQVNKEKEDEKQKQRSDAVANRKLRLEKAKREREERAARMKEKQQESTTSTENTTEEKVAAAKPLEKNEEQTNKGLIEAPAENKVESTAKIGENTKSSENPKPEASKPAATANKAAAFNRFAMMKNSNTKKIEPVKKQETKQQESTSSGTATQPASNSDQKSTEPAAPVTNNAKKIQLPARFQRISENKDVKKEEEKKDEKDEKKDDKKDEKDNKDEKDDKKDEKDEKKDDKKDEKDDKKDEKDEKKDEKAATTGRRPVNFSNFKVIPKIAPASPKPKSDTEIKPPTTSEGNQQTKEKPSGTHLAALQNFTNSKKTKSFTIPQAIKKRDISKSGSQIKEIQIIKSAEDERAVPMIRISKTLVDTELIREKINAAVREYFSENSLEVVSDASENKFEFYHYTVKGPRPANEDEFTVVEHLNEYLNIPGEDNYSFAAVYDGHCGKYTSLYVRSQLHHKACQSPHFQSNPEKAIFDAFLQVDDIVNEIQQTDQFACGTTALQVWVKNNKELIVANVGDCRGYLCRQNEPLEIAKPHHPNSAEEKARITGLGGAVVWHGAWRVNGILAVSRSIGDVNLKKWVIPNPDLTKFTIQPDDDFLVIASDGLWDVIQPKDMVEIVRETCKTLGRKQVCQQLCEAALKKNTQDNVTVVTIFFTPETPVSL